MTLTRLLAGRHILTRSVIAAGLILLGAAGLRLGMAANRFPFDQDLLLNAARMGHAKRVPILNVTTEGRATIDLWCRSVSGRVQLSDDAMRIEPGPLPQSLPQYMIDGQCTPERMQADNGDARRTAAGDRLAPARRCGDAEWPDDTALPGEQPLNLIRR